MKHTLIKTELAHYIDANFDEQVKFLQKLVQKPSDNPPGDCAPHAALAASLLENLGFVVERHHVPDQKAKQHGMISVTNLIIREHFGPGPTVALNAHGDVVPPGEGWTFDPYGGEVHNGWMYGRGAAVSKSDFATYAYALKALKACNAQLNGTIELHFTYDEETGGMVGPGLLLEQGISSPDYVLSAAFSHNVIVAHNGCLHLEICVRGQSAHAALPASGHDALEATVPLLQQLYEYRDGLLDRPSKTPGIEHPTLVVGLISGGINTNVVPDTVTLRIDRRITPEEQPEAVEKELQDLISASVANLDGIKIEVNRILLARPFTPAPGADKLAELVCREATAVMGETATTIGVPLYTDARLYSEANIPTVMYGAGPRSLLEANGHRADERLPLDSLQKATKVVANTLVELLGD